MEIVVTLGWVSKLATGSGDIPENESVCGPSQFFSCEKLLEVSSWIRECMDFFFYVNRKKDVVLHSGQKRNEMQRKGSSCSGIGKECAKILVYCALRFVESSFTAVDKPVDMKEFLSFGLRRFSAISRGGSLRSGRRRVALSSPVLA